MRVRTSHADTHRHCCRLGQTEVVPLTALQLALGRDRAPLDLSLYRDAVSEKVTETDQLDWKGALPTKAESLEFAKDVAAMANSGGGMVVYGVFEDEMTSAAREIAGVEGWGDAEQRRLRAVAYSTIRPPVHGLTFDAVRLDDERHVVALLVPPSPDSPHLVWSGGNFTAPIRYGATTAYMSERQLEQGYRTRFDQREGVDAELDKRLEQLGRGLDLNERVWFTAAAIPLVPRPSQLGRVGREVARCILTESITENPYIAAPGMRSGSLSVNPQAGHRRWRAVDMGYRGALQGIVEIHDDGGVSLATLNRNSPSSGFEESHVHVGHVQIFVGELGHLIDATARALAPDTAYAIRVKLSAGPSYATGNPKPIYIRTFDPHGSFARDLSELTPIHQFIAVDAVLEPGTRSALSVVREIATDIINQGGAAEAGDTYLRRVEES